MIDLSKHIEYLLLKDNEVIVPGLGTFITNYVPSTWVEDEELLLPPFRSVSFNKNFNGDDTFVNSLAEKNNISVQEAGILCMEFVENFFQELHDNGTTDIGSIGYFNLTESEGEIEFVPCQAGVASPSLYGLDAITANVISQLGVQEFTGDRKVVTTGISTEKDTVVIRLNRRFINFATSIAASVVLFFLFTSPAFNSYDEGTEKATNEILLLKHSKKQMVAEPVKETTIAATPEEEVVEKSTEIKEETEEAPEEVVAEEATSEEVTPSEEYVIVLASALSTKNAERYAKEMTERGYSASIQPTKKYNRVIIRGFATSEEALQRAREMKEESPEFKNIWTKKL